MSTPPPESTDPESPQCPWASHPATGEHERLSPPAPMIELDTPQQAQPVNPLGPRRLARLQREMAEHAQRIQESEAQAGGGAVDEELLAAQHRLADLAVRAAAANDRDREDAERALAADPDSPAGTGPRTGAPGSADAARPDTGDRITVAFPRTAATGAGGLDLGVSTADPASLPASHVHYGPVTTQIPVYTAPREDTAARDEATGAEDSAAGPSGPGPRGAGASVPGPAVSGPAVSGGAARSAGTAGTAASSDGSGEAPAALPAQPVRAVDAEGLQLLDPGAYTRGSTTLRVVLGLLLAVVVALAVALVIFIL